MLDFSTSEIPKDAALDGPFTADECSYKEPNNTLATAAPVQPGDTGPAALCPTTPGGDDIDYYGFTVPAGATTVTISIQFTSRPGGDLDLELFDAIGMRAQSRGIGDGERIVCPAMSPPCTALAPGDYVFEVLPGTAADVNAYTFDLKIE